MALLENLLLQFSDYAGTIAFLGAFLGGDSVVIFLAGLAGQGLMPLWKVFVFLILGTIISDVLVFSIGRTKYFKRIVGHRYVKKGYDSVVAELDRFFHKKVLVVLIIAKFMYGTRFITLFYLGNKGITSKRFVWYDSIATFIWVIVLGTIGWLAGKGLANYISIIDNVELGTALLIGLTAAIYLVQRGIDKLFYKKIENS